MHRSILLALASAGLLAVLVALTPWTGAGKARALANCDVSDADLDASEQQMLVLLAQARSSAGLGALTPGASLHRAAAWQSASLEQPGVAFSHIDPLGRNWYRRMLDCGYNQGASENIAAGSVGLSPSFIFAQWMASPGHRAAILTPSFKAVGVARHGGSWTMTFGCEVESAATSIGTPGLTCLGGGSPGSGSIAAPATTVAAPSGSTCDAPDSAMDAAEQQFLTLMNQQRAAAGLPALTATTTLTRAAAWKAADSSSAAPPPIGRHEPDSLGRSYVKRIDDCNVNGYSGEIIAWSSTPQGALALFNSDPPHKAQIMEPRFKAAGIARHGSAWVIEFSSLVDTSIPSTAASPSPMPTNSPTPSPTPQTWRVVVPLVVAGD